MKLDKLRFHFRRRLIHQIAHLNQPSDQGGVFGDQDLIRHGNRHQASVGMQGDELFKNRYCIRRRQIGQRHDIGRHHLPLRKFPLIRKKKDPFAPWIFTPRRVNDFDGVLIHRNEGVSVQKEGGFQQTNRLCLRHRLVQGQAQIGPTRQETGIFDEGHPFKFFVHDKKIGHRIIRKLDRIRRNHFRLSGRNIFIRQGHPQFSHSILILSRSLSPKKKKQPAKK